jgi:hypothetical protein
VVNKSDLILYYATMNNKIKNNKKRIIRVILEQSRNENTENCWKPLIAQLTKTWLETTGVNVIKIAEIGQSAAERLKHNKKCKGEGSETMHGTSHVEDDIVQTATKNKSVSERICGKKIRCQKWLGGSSPPLGNNS